MANSLFHSLLLFAQLSAVALCQVGATTPLAARCSSLPNATNVACINKYGAVMPYPFNRTVAYSIDSITADSFRYTSVPSDPSFAQYVTNGTFIVFDDIRGRQILGPNPQYDKVFTVSNVSIHEAPVYVPQLESIIFSLPHQGVFEQQLLNLSDPANPTLRNYTTTPPVYAVNGGKLWGGHIYWAVEGGIPFPDPSNTSQMIMQAPGIYRLDPMTGKVETLLNNYYGTVLNSPNDLWVDSAGDVFFTDGWYGWAINVTAVPPPNTAAVIRLRPSTGQAQVVENSISQPNGIAFSPDGKKCYVTDTGATDFKKAPSDGSLPRYGWNPHGGKSVYAFDVNGSPAGSYLTNKRVIFRAEEFANDGFHVSREGYILGASGYGVDVYTEYGEYLVRIYTDFLVNNIQFAGPDRSDLWLFGMGGIARVKWNLHGVLEE